MADSQGTRYDGWPRDNKKWLEAVLRRPVPSDSVERMAREQDARCGVNVEAMKGQAEAEMRRRGWPLKPTSRWQDGEAFQAWLNADGSEIGEGG